MDKRSKKDRSLQRVWNGSVFFSYFTRTRPKKRHATLDTLRRAYARNAALLAPKNLEGCDLILPVLLQGQQKMSYVLIQVKNDKSLVQGSKQNENALADLSPHKTLDDPGYFMGIWMSLRSKPAGKRKKASNTVVDVLSHGKKIVAVASGLDDTLYPALGELEDAMGSNRIVEKLQALLECTDDINVPGKSRFLERFYAIDDESL